MDGGWERDINSFFLCISCLLEDQQQQQQQQQQQHKVVVQHSKRLVKQKRRSELTLVTSRLYCDICRAAIIREGAGRQAGRQAGGGQFEQISLSLLYTAVDTVSVPFYLLLLYLKKGKKERKKEGKREGKLFYN